MVNFILITDPQNEVKVETCSPYKQPYTNINDPYKRGQGKIKPSRHEQFTIIDFTKYSWPSIWEKDLTFKTEHYRRNNEN